MTTAIERAIKKAVEKGGYKTAGMEIRGITTLADNPRAVVFEIPSYGVQTYRRTVPHDEIFLDRHFWQALATIKGYVGDAVCTSVHYLEEPHKIPYWEYLWCTFIDHLASGGDAD